MIGLGHCKQVVRFQDYLCSSVFPVGSFSSQWLARTLVYEKGIQLLPYLVTFVFQAEPMELSELWFSAKEEFA